MLPRKIALSMMAIILLMPSVGTGRAQAQTVSAITSEFEVSGSSHLFSGALGLDSVDVDGQSRILIAWNKGPVPGEAFDNRSDNVPPLDFQRGVYVSTYSLTGESLREPIRVDEPGNPGWPSAPILAADAEGRFVVVWRQAQESGRLPRYSIWMRPFDAEGEPLADAEKLAHDTEVLPSLDMAPTGEFVIVFGRTEPKTSDNFNLEPPQFQLYDAGFLPTHESPQFVDTSLTGSSQYSLISAVSLNRNGEFAVAYIESQIFSYDRVRRLRLRTFSADGLPISQPIEVESGAVWGLDVKWLDDSYFVAAWRQNSRYYPDYPTEGYWQVFERNGQSASQLFSSGLTRGQGGILNISETEFAVVWATETGLTLIHSSLDTQSQRVPLNITNTTLEDLYQTHVPGWGGVGSPVGLTPLEDGQFAVVWTSKIQGREQVRAEVLEDNIENNMAVFEAEVVSPCIADRWATVRLSWSSSSKYADIYVAGPPAKKLFAKTRGTGELLTGQWAKHGMAFHLIDPDTGFLLATVKADLGADSCPSSPISIEPSAIEVCDPRERMSAEVLWDVTDVSVRVVEVRVNRIDGPLFALSGRRGSKLTGEWLKNGMTFYLLERDTGDLLGTVSSEYQQVACP